MSTPNAPKRGPYARSRQRREQIALAVLELIDEAGHEGVTTALVAKRSKTSEPTVLYHFPTKDHLLVAALERADDVALAFAEAENPDMKSADLLENLRLWADPTRFNGERRIRLHVMLQGQAATPDHPAAEYFLRRTERGLRAFAALIADRQREGLAHPGLDPQETARQFNALWAGLTLMWVNDQTLDLAPLLVDGFRRLTGENWMRARALLDGPGVGL
ncbi:TetR/AcrR family transcriptional regulator [Streptomyces sp. NPDC048278]|uniref:TetR/AcrR family transcriptional regulator n=1 Tax=Streptomyces sp. NPDC048278 TaxID=3155809 RepID=UPI003412D148